MNQDNFDAQDDDLNSDEIDELVAQALGEVRNLAGSVAELQNTDEAAEQIYAMCDLVAAYHGIERDVAVTEEHDDGSFTTRFERGVPEVDVRKISSTPRSHIPGHLNMRGNSNKRRIIDRDSSPDIEDLDD